MAPSPRSRLTVVARAAAPVLLLAFAAALLLRFPPARYSFYPQCPIHYYFGILCPGCGTTRALAALLHGNLSEAFRLNALTTMLLPIAIAYAAVSYLRMITRKPFRWPHPPPSTIYGALAATAIFTIARNL